MNTPTPPTAILYYVHDPMCSWCYAFRPTWQTIREQLPSDISVRYVLGGLAADSEEPMPLETQQMVQDAWHKIIQAVPGTIFNFDFWQQCQARRSTYPSCRAVLAAKAQGTEHEIPMIAAIQNAYYQQTRNPSDATTLIAVAKELGLDSEQFARDLRSAVIEQQLQDELALADSIGASSFPSLILKRGDTLQRIEYSYTDPAMTLQQLIPA